MLLKRHIQNIQTKSNIMKNSILTVLAVATIVSCNKKETTIAGSNSDSLTMSTSDSPTTLNDSATTADNMRTDNTMLSSQDKMFADAASTGSMMEVMTGKLAETNASSAAVKSLAAMIVKDHTMAGEELKKWASANNYSLPAAMTTEQQAMFDELKMKKGAEFDKAYAKMMVSDHKKDIDAFKKQSSEGKDTSLKTFASNTLPTLEKHLKEAQKVDSSMK